MSILIYFFNIFWKIFLLFTNKLPLASLSSLWVRDTTFGTSLLILIFPLFFFLPFFFLFFLLSLFYPFSILFHFFQCREVVCGSCSPKTIRIAAYDDEQRVCNHCLVSSSSPSSPSFSSPSPSSPTLSSSASYSSFSSFASPPGSPSSELNAANEWRERFFAIQSSILYLRNRAVLVYFLFLLLLSFYFFFVIKKKNTNFRIRRNKRRDVWNWSIWKLVSPWVMLEWSLRLAFPLLLLMLISVSKLLSKNTVKRKI